MKFGIINITSFCNQKCIFCSEGDMHKNPKHISYNKVIEILDDLKNNNVEAINFMGGECTLRPDLGKILNYCNLNFKLVSIVTNGILFFNYKYANSILYKINTFEFSWHTNNKEVFYKLSESKNYNLFQKSLNNISEILTKRESLGITINHVVNKINYKDISSFVKLVINKFPLKYKNNRFIAIKRTNIVGYAIINKDKLLISPEKVLPYLKKAIRYSIKNKVYIQIEGFPPCFFNEFMESKYFLLNELDNQNLYLLNKIDISKINNVSNFKKSDIFSYKIYLNGDIILNKSILKKCKKCLARKICHNILLSRDSHILTNNFLNYIGKGVSKKDIKENIFKRDEFINNLLKI